MLANKCQYQINTKIRGARLPPIFQEKELIFRKIKAMHLVHCKCKVTKLNLQSNLKQSVEGGRVENPKNKT